MPETTPNRAIYVSRQKRGRSLKRFSGAMDAGAGVFLFPACAEMPT